MAEVSGSNVRKVDSEEIECILGNRGENHVEIIIKDVWLSQPIHNTLDLGETDLWSGIRAFIISANVPARTFLM